MWSEFGQVLLKGARDGLRSTLLGVLLYGLALVLLWMMVG